MKKTVLFCLIGFCLALTLSLGEISVAQSGAPETITITDQFDRTVTIPTKVERVVSLIPECTRIMIALGAQDKLVGISSYDHNSIVDVYPTVFPEGKKLPDVGKIISPNHELIASLKPDVVFGGWSYPSEAADDIQKKTGIPVICIYSKKTIADTFKEIQIVGQVVGKPEEAEKLIEFFKDKIGQVTKVTSTLADSEKPKVYLAFWSGVGKPPTITRTPVVYEPLDLAGAKNVAGECSPSGSGWLPLAMGAEISAEQIVQWNPQLILIHRSAKGWGIEVKDILADPKWKTLQAVKDKKVFYTPGMISGWDHARLFTEILYMAKLAHPDKFKDLDLEKEGNEIFKRFYGVDGLWTSLAEECGYNQWK